MTTSEQLSVLRLTQKDVYLAIPTLLMKLKESPTVPLPAFSPENQIGPSCNLPPAVKSRRKVQAALIAQSCYLERHPLSPRRFLYPPPPTPRRRRYLKKVFLNPPPPPSTSNDPLRPNPSSALDTTRRCGGFRGFLLLDLVFLAIFGSVAEVRRLRQGTGSGTPRNA